MDTAASKEYRKLCERPICFSDILKNANRGDYLLKPEALEEDCLKIFKNAMIYNEVKDDLYKAAVFMRDRKVIRLFGFEEVRKKLNKNKFVTADENLYSEKI
jgi:hypothetical protein